MDTSIELRYAGVVIGRATAAGDINGGRLFLAIPDPLPVGTRVGLKIDEQILEGRVVAVTESSDLTKCGMTVERGVPDALPATAAPPAAPPPPATASPSSPAPSSQPASSPPASSAAAAPPSPTPPADEVRGAAEDAASDGAGGPGDAASDGIPVAEESSGPSGGGGGGGGGRRRRRKR